MKTPPRENGVLIVAASELELRGHDGLVYGVAPRLVAAGLRLGSALVAWPTFGMLTEP